MGFMVPSRARPTNIASVRGYDDRSEGGAPRIRTRASRTHPEKRLNGDCCSVIGTLAENNPYVRECTTHWLFPCTSCSHADPVRALSTDQVTLGPPTSAYLEGESSHC